MKEKNKKILSEHLTQIRAIIAAQPDISRAQLARQVCESIGLYSANGTLQTMSCRKKLLSLHRQGQITLPEAKSHPNLTRSSMQNNDEAFPEPVPVECSLTTLGQIQLVRVKCGNRQQSKKWNAMMQRYHYLGAGPLCGAQMRYFIESEHFGILGGLAFSAAAWHLSPRDHWIGWDDNIRQQRLDRIVNNSRFLILPQVNVKNLASHVLALATKQIKVDWPAQYGVTPLLVETFVETGRFQGTCYRAANWQHLGQTQGRGRQDRNNARAVKVKDIYVFLLHKEACNILNAGSFIAPQPRRRPAIDWVEEEFFSLDLGDRRANERLMTIVRDFYARPQANIPQACQTRARTKAAYRFMDKDTHSMDKILTPHFQTTVARMQAEKVVLAPQDTSSLNYSTHPATENLGPISTQKDGVIGLLLHDTMAFNEEGTPLGLLDAQCWARNPDDFGKRQFRHQTPIEQKESYKWLKSYQAVSVAQKQCPNTLVVSLGDREADIYELFDMALSQPGGAKLLVRANHDRLLAEGHEKLWTKVQNQPVSGIQEIHVPRQGKRKARTASLEVRFAQVMLKPPSRKNGLKTLTLWAVLAQEINCSDDLNEPLEWMLLTTIEVTTFGQATEKLAWYAGRWGIEVYHRTLKSGCKIEERQLGSADRIETCLAIDMIVAWRVFHLTKLGREVPDLPCTVFFEDAEWKALVAYKTQNPVPPENPPTLREAVHMVGSLGGHLGRKCDGEPGTKSLWLGLQRLDDIKSMWEIMVQQSISKNKSAPGVQNTRCG